MEFRRGGLLQDGSLQDPGRVKSVPCSVHLILLHDRRAEEPVEGDNINWVVKENQKASRKWEGFEFELMT